MVSLQLKPNFLAPDVDEIGTKKDDYVTSNQTESCFVFNSNHSLPIIEQRKRLPIYKYRKDILYCLEKNQVLIVVGETGSGKSTQLPQYLYELGWHTKGVIGLTQPRRISAITLANRVALERGEIIGDTVGFVVKFLEKCSDATAIKYMTEGILLRELLTDPLLMRYSVIVIDEAHERSLITDIILGLLKKIVSKRPALKLVISSATIDADDFADFFKANSSIILSVEGRSHPIGTFYLNKPCADYVNEAVETVWKIHKKEAQGDILVFLTGQEEVMQAVSLTKDYMSSNDDSTLQPVPMYGSLTHREQLKVFFAAEKGVRKVVYATNIAETSITIPGVVYVVDCGFMKLKWFDSDSATDQLVVVPISKATAIQRAGRAGRTRSGKVYRLFTEEDYEKLPDRFPPEIRRCELSAMILALAALGISNILKFNFPSAPPAKNVLAALETLHALGAIDNDGTLTKPLGYFMAEMPLPPMLSRMLYMSVSMGCSEEILTIISMLQVESVFAQPATGQGQIKARVAKRHFEVAEGDLLTLLNVFTAFVENDQSKQFCRTYYLNYRNLNCAYELREQLVKLAKKHTNISLKSCEGNVETICKCITSAFFLNAAYLHYTGVYKRIQGGLDLYIHPLSTLYTLPQPQYIIFTELVHTTKLFMSNVTVIREEWLAELSSHYYYKTSG
ncbi:probable ATP-dependent RNA helicase DHX35 [Rhagoletis pomonella]|uniref:probable ATP-dependent RNA helicase DHX35 n=1 Tax=Rhagoletis pomonella TaxID=28610 RepID=UPI00177F4D4B|nr:probable ATP-dependent RNA helicase DHX35 [Rhagoletis pomonella]